MRFALDSPNSGDYSDPRLLAEIAREAEIAGWDGFFLWDHSGASWGLSHRRYLDCPGRDSNDNHAHHIRNSGNAAATSPTLEVGTRDCYT